MENKEDEDFAKLIMIMGKIFYKGRKGKGKAMKASTWDLESKSKKEDDSAYMCFMVQGDDPLEVSSESHSDCNNLSMDEIASFFEIFEEKYNLLKLKNKNMKNQIVALKNNIDLISQENDSLKNQLDFVLKEKEKTSFNKVKKDFVSHANIVSPLLTRMIFAF